MPTKKKISELTSGTIAAEDLIEFVDDPSGTPASKKGTIQGILDLVAGSPSIYDATAGATGADYTTVNAAVTAGKRTILVIDDTTEDADIAVPATGLEIYIKPDVTLDLAAYQITFAQAANLLIKGLGDGSTLKYTHTSSAKAIDTSSYTTSVVKVEDLDIDNNSTVTTNYLCINTCVQKLKNLVFYMPNVGSNGFYFNNRESVAENITLIGGGSSCYLGMYLYKGFVDGLFITGSYDNNSLITSTGTVDDITLRNVQVDDITNPGNSSLYIAGNVSGINIGDTDDAISIVISSNGTVLSNVQSTATNNTSNIDVNEKQNCIISDCNIAGSLVADGANTVVNNVKCGASLLLDGATMVISNVFNTGATTRINGSYCLVSNLRSNGGAVTINGDYNRLIGAVIGTGGTAYNLVISSGADNNRAVEILADAANSDSGAGNTVEEVVF